MKRRPLPVCRVLLAAASVTLVFVIATLGGLAYGQATRESSYLPVDPKEDVSSVIARMKAAKASVMQRQRQLLEQRNDLADRRAAGVTMARAKPVQDGVRVKLPQGLTWQQLGGMTPEEIKAKNAFPAGFLPLPHANHPEGGMVLGPGPHALRPGLRPS